MTGGADESSFHPAGVTEVDLSRWLEPGEEVVWLGGHSRRGLPWAALTATLAASAFVFWFTLVFNAHRPPVAFNVVVAVVVTIVPVIGAFVVRRDRAHERYVLTDRRAAVFLLPGELLTQVAVTSPYFYARYARSAGSRPADDTAGGGAGQPRRARLGTIDWGESDLRRRRRGQEAIRAMAWTLGIADPQRVIFADVDDLGHLMAVTRVVRSRWSAPTPDAAEPQVRGRPPEALGFLDTAKAGRYNVAALIVSGGSLLIGAVLWALTFSTTRGTFRQLPIQILYGTLFLSFVWIVMLIVGRRQRPGQKLFANGDESRWGRAYLSVFAYLQKWMAAVVLVVLIGAWACGVLALSHLPGQPAYSATRHRYIYSLNGKVTLISHARYLWLTATENRFFLCGVLAFGIICLGLSVDEIGRRRRIAPAPAPAPVPVGGLGHSQGSATDHPRPAPESEAAPVSDPSLPTST